MTDVFRTMIVPATLITLARNLGAGLSPGGVGMFTTGLSPTGASPATHYVSTGMIGDRFAECIISGDALYAACTEAGATVAQGLCDTLVAESDVTEEEPFTAFARLGLQLIQEVIE